MKRTFRIYIDEFGCDGYQRLDVPSNRFLNLTGVIVERGDPYTHMHDAFQRMKKEMFGQSESKPVIFHRTCIRRAKPPFNVFRNDPCVRRVFDYSLISVLLKGEYKILSVTFDKVAYSKRRNKSELALKNPYAFCMEWLMERYVIYLREMDGVGDVAAEMRGFREDKALRNAFDGLIERGSSVSPSFKEDFRVRLTKKRLQLRDKKMNDTGIQLADLICKPAHKYILDYKGKVEMGNGFSARLSRLLVAAEKFRTNPGNNHTDGFGTKLME